jgi:uncharacterized protein YggT (Ycf19 family)
MRLLYSAVEHIFELYGLLIVCRCILPWLPLRRDSVVVRFLVTVTEPYLGFFRRFLNRRYTTPIDFSPVLAMLTLFLLRWLVRGFLLILF